MSTLLRSSRIRVVIGVVALVSALAGSPWLTAICLLYLCIFFRAYEAPLIALVTDFMWQPAGVHMPLLTLGSLAALLLLEPLRRELLM